MTEELDYSDIEAKYAVPPPPEINNVILIDNAPKVDSSKEEKLLSKIRQVFQNIEVIKPDGIYMPKDDSGMSKGFIFIEFSSDEKARLAVELGNGTKFGSYVLSMHLFADIERCANASEEFIAPVIPEFQPKDHSKSWLMDRRARDQFAMVKGEEVGIYFHNRGENPEAVTVRQNWADFFVQFSSQGTYFATVFKQGVALWAGSELVKFNRFQHSKVKKLEFSPKENYLVTWSEESFKTSTGDLHNICVWDIKTAALLRTFPTPKQENVDGSKADNEWPFLKWSHDDTYVSRYTTGPKGAIFVYEAKDMSLLGKKSIKIENLQSMDWSPCENIISYWTPEAGNIPARIMLINIPTRTVVRTKNFFGLLSCKMYWHPEGNYLLAKVERLKTKSTKATSFEVFRLKEKDIPIDLTEVADAEEIKSDIFWEPSGNKFSFLVSDDTSSSAYVYEVMPPKTAQAIKQLGKVDARGMNMIMWSPKGRFCVLAGSRGHSGSLIFYDFQDLVLLNRQEHYGFTSLEWDPTGRYVTSSTSLWKSAVDTGISIWSMIGEELTKQNIVGFKQFTWRPRPKTLLPLEDQERIISNLKDYYKEFEEEDAMASNKASAEVQAKRQEQWKEYKAMIKEFLSKKTAESKKRIDYIGYDPLQSDTETLVEVTIEEVIEETEKLLV